MPHSLVILENHLDTSAYQFLFDNAHQLKALGYTQMLFELNNQHEPSVYMSQIRQALPFMQESPIAKSAKMVLKVYDTFCDLGFICRFIDPEPENIATAYNERLKQAYNQNDSKRIATITSERNEATKQRDFVMANIILDANQSSREKGGIIFVGGFLHKNLIKQLEIRASQTEHPFRYAIFHGYLPRSNPNLIDANQRDWLAIQDDSYRSAFYGTDSIKHLDPSQYTFEMIKAALSLSSSIQYLEEGPSIAPILNNKTTLSFKFYSDEQSIVSATLKIKNHEAERTASKIKALLPGLHFFSQQIPGTENSEVCIPGTNLSDQRTPLNELYK